MIMDGCQGKPRTPTIREKTCPVCGNTIEIFSTDTQVACDKCGFVAYNDALSCVQWCQYARKCVGDEMYERMMEIARRHLEAQGLQNLGTQPFVFYGITQIGALIAYYSQGEFQDMCGWRGAFWHPPGPAIFEQRGFFLSAGDGYSEVLVRIYALSQQEIGRSNTQLPGDIGFGHGF